MSHMDEAWELPNLPHFHRGKTRDTYSFPYMTHAGAPNEALLLVYATDRISTHDVVHQSLIPKKGQVLTAFTVFWLLQALEKAGLRNHVVAYGRDIYQYLPEDGGPYPKDLHLCAIIVRKLSITPVEFVFRNYLTGSLYNHYKEGRDPYGLRLPSGLPKMYQFSEPVFTPTKKSDAEHDPPLVAREVITQYPQEYALAQQAFLLITEHLAARGITLIDSKFEVGHDPKNDQYFLADEIVTPDSSRFVRTDQIVEGEDPPWLDKEIARQAALAQWGDGERVPLRFPPLSVSRLSDACQEAFRLCTGMRLRNFQDEHLN